ncbi:MAG: PucR family transcriptional regulator [Actinomycetota bacterium]
MPLRIDDIVRLPGLALSSVTGRVGLDRSVRWVHVSELEDPTPWLKGGELLLTTGMGVGKSPARQRAYVSRLAEADLAGLGFGTGFSFSRVPKPVVDTGRRLRFPIFEVPYPVPFIAITETVFTRLLGEQYDVLQRSLEAQHALTLAVLEGTGLMGLTEALAAAIDGWAVVLDRHGVVLAAAPRSARARAARLWEEFGNEPPEASAFSLSLSDRGDHVALQPVGARGRVEAFLAVGKRDALSQFDRIVASHALALVAIELDKMRAVAAAEHRLAGDFFDALVRGEASERERTRGLHQFGFDSPGRVTVLALTGGVSPDELAWALEDVLSRSGGAFLTATREEALFALVPSNGTKLLDRIHRDVSAAVGDDVRVAAGSDVAPDDVAKSFREARYALEVCKADGRPIANFDSLGTYRLLLTLQEPDALRAFADSVLGPLDEYDAEHGGELIASLRAFLDHNARWEAAAGELFVHRHTLRYRMRKVEELTHRDLNSAHHRIEFWLALRAREIVAPADAT